MTLKYRILIIIGLIIASAAALFPRTVKERVKGPNGFVYDMHSDAIRTFLETDVVRMRSVRLNTPLPTPYDALRIYDNGGGQVYHMRPKTPYQR